MLSVNETIDRLIDAGKRLYIQGLMPGGAGNLSARTDDGIVVTPSGLCKGKLARSDFVIVDSGGSIIRGGTPTSELPMHLAIYNECPAVNAVVHIHGAYAVALTVAGIAFHSDILPEIPLKFGEIPVTDYATPSTPRSAEVLKPHLKNGICGAILPHHGIVAFAEDIERAVLIAEGIEYAAKVQVLASAIGTPRPFPKGKT